MVARRPCSEQTPNAGNSPLLLPSLAPCLLVDFFPDFVLRHQSGEFLRTQQSPHAYNANTKDDTKTRRIHKTATDSGAKTEYAPDFAFVQLGTSGAHRERLAVDGERHCATLVLALFATRLRWVLLLHRFGARATHVRRSAVDNDFGRNLHRARRERTS